MSKESEDAFNRLSQAVNLKYYVGKGCANIIRDACFKEDKPVPVDRGGNPIKKKAKPGA